MTTFTEDQIRSRHKERVSALVDLFGSTMAIPNDIIKRLQERNKEDWIQFVAERDGKAKSDPNAPLMPVVTDEQVAAVEQAESILAEDTETTDPDPEWLASEERADIVADVEWREAALNSEAQELPAAVLECEAAGTHLQSCDENGYCNACGHQEATDNVEIS